jgi:hypothetical protein
MKGVDAFETHSFIMKRGKNNSRGEPTYFSLCESCGMKTSEAVNDYQPCKGQLSHDSSRSSGTSTG